MATLVSAAADLEFVMTSPSGDTAPVARAKWNRNFAKLLTDPEVIEYADSLAVGYAKMNRNWQRIDSTLEMIPEDRRVSPFEAATIANLNFLRIKATLR